MFVRVIKGKNKEYVSIVRNFRDEKNRVRQKTVYSLGPAANEEVKAKLMAKAKAIITQESGQLVHSDPASLRETSRHNWGAEVVVEYLWQRLSLSDILTDSRYTHALKLLLADRFLSPKSKRATFMDKDFHASFHNVEMQHLYRALDQLFAHQEPLKDHIFAYQRQYGSVDIVFFDVTTLYFESKKADALKDFGYSKDCKFNEVQVVLSLAINKEGRPLTYELFPGHCFEGKTLLPTLLKFKERYNINRVIVVADRGMGSADNLGALKAAGFDYIVGARLRSASAAIKAQALDAQGYSVFHQTHEDCVMYKTIAKPQNKKNDLQDKWLCLWSSKRAQKDAKDRIRLIEKANDLLRTNNLTDKRGAKKYILTDKVKKSAKIDHDKIQQDASFDGYYALSFSDENMAPVEIFNAYHTLWAIEDSFRTLKSFFEARPMFHWTEKRIHGHILLNFISLVMQKEIELTLQENGAKMSQNDLRKAIKGMEYSILQFGETTIKSYAPITPHQNDILRALKLKPPKNVATPTQN